VLQVLLFNRHFAGCNRAGILAFDRPWADLNRRPAYVEMLAIWNGSAVPLDLAGQRYPLEMSWMVSSGIRNQPVFVNDVHTEPGLPEYARQLLVQLEVHSFAMFPLNAGGEWYGVLAVQFITPGVFSAEDLRHVEGLVDQAAVAIHNIRLFEAEARARKAAEQANELKLRFLAMISHELRTPLTSIKGFATTLLAEDVTWDAASQRDFIETINQEADKLTDMIDQLLDLSRLGAGVLRIHPAPHALTRIIATAMAQLQTIATHYHLLIDVPEQLPPVMADRQRVAQVVTNLVDNAAKYSPRGTEITISASASDEYVQLNVSDQGSGIPAAEREQVFEAFQRGTGESTRRTKGAGLGLAICKGLIEAHSGRIWIADQTGPGTTISFTLPVAHDQAPAM
jgi:two-component system sensor histidine kinase KdpD